MEEDKKALSCYKELIHMATEIICLQSSVIEEQFVLLTSYMTAEEVDRYPLYETMKSGSELRAALDI